MPDSVFVSMVLTEMIYSWPLNNTGMECVGPLERRLIVYHSKYYSATLSMFMEELYIWRADYKLYTDFWLSGESVPLTPALFKS